MNIKTVFGGGGCNAHQTPREEVFFGTFSLANLHDYVHLHLCLDISHAN